jgi:hypothetical protein
MMTMMTTQTMLRCSSQISTSRTKKKPSISNCFIIIRDCTHLYIKLRMSYMALIAVRTMMMRTKMETMLSLKKECMLILATMSS